LSVTLTSDTRHFWRRRRRGGRDDDRLRGRAGVFRRVFGVARVPDVGRFDGHGRVANGGLEVARVRGR
jgi:hypothetical protein